MATYDEIHANFTLFKQIITSIDDCETKAGKCVSETFCLTLADDDWPDALAEFRTKYDEVHQDVNGDTEIGYARAVKRMGDIESALTATLRGYIEAEMEAESAIRNRLQALLGQI